MINLEDHEHLRKKKRIHIFKFEENWTKDSRCEEIVRRNWAGDSDHCQDKLMGIQAMDSEFEEYRISEIKKELNMVEQLLKNDDLWNGGIDDLARYRELKRKHVDLLQKEETAWRQRSKATWLKEGDKNSKFFHTGKPAKGVKLMPLIS